MGCSSSYALPLPLPLPVELPCSLLDLDSIVAQKTRMTIFGSSTFTDTKVERRVMTSNILPKLQEKGRRFGILITMFDMRYGVKDDNLKEHLIWETCRNEIQRSYEESSGSFFLSMQGDKYGFRTIPRLIRQADFETRFASWTDLSLKDLANEWYKLDENCVPPSYVLRPLEDYNDKSYWGNYWRLRDGFEGLAFEEGYPDIVVGSSITEWETRYALGKGDALTRRRSFWIRRIFEDAITKDVDPYHHFIENIDRSTYTRDLCNGMKTYLEAILQSDDIFDLKCPSLSDLCNIREVVPPSKDMPYGDYIFDDPSRKGFEYLEAWEKTVHTRLENELDKLIEEVKVWSSADRNNYRISGDDLNEILHHHTYAKTKASSYYGRQALLDQCMRMVSGSYLVGNRKLSASKVASVCLGVVGVTGSGKTTLMSKFSVQCRSLYSDLGIPVIIRFCGTSVQSTDGLSLIRSISIELMQHYKSQIKGSFPLSSSYKDVLPFFRDLLSKYPVVLLIDSLDQLSDAYEERSRLSFLADIRLHEKSRIVVSCLPDDSKYKYLCEQRLTEAGTPRVDVGLLDMSDTREVRHILSRILRDRYNRVISKEDQFQIALASAKAESSPLYLTLAARVISTWCSYDEVGGSSAPSKVLHLQPTVPGIVNQIFASLSIAYGKELVRHAIFFITYSVAGVNDNEMQDLLTMSDRVMAEVKSGETAKYFAIFDNRLPFHVWSRLCFALKGLIVEKANNCWQWYHRQLKEAADALFSLEEVEKMALHSIMGIYFGNLNANRGHVIHTSNGGCRSGVGFVFCNDFSSMTCEYNVTKQPLLLNSEEMPLRLGVWSKEALVNTRRCLESAHHLIECGMYKAAVDELCDIEGICARCKVGPGVVFTTIGYLEELKTKSLDPECMVKVVHFLRWLRRSVDLINKNPTSYIVSTIFEQPKESILVQEMNKVLHENYPASLSGFSSIHEKSDVWTRCRQLGGYDKFDGMTAVYRGHKDTATSVCLSVDGKTLFSSSYDFTVRAWDLASGKCSAMLEGHTTNVTSVCVSIDGKFLFSSSGDKKIRTWDLASEKCVAVLEGHDGGVTSACVSADGKSLFSSSWDNTVRAWDLLSGKCSAVLVGHTGGVTSVCLSIDCKSLFSSSDDETLRAWDIGSGKCITMFEGHEGGVTSVCLSKDDKTLFSSSWDKTVRAWDLKSGKCSAVLEGHAGGVSSVRASIDAKSLFSSSSDNTVRMWDLASGKCKAVLEGHTGGITSLCVSLDGKSLFSTSGDKTVRFWDLASVGYSVLLDGHSKEVTSVCVSVDGKSLFSSSDDNTIRVWDFSSEKCIAVLEGHMESVTSVFVSPDGKSLFSSSKDNTVRIWDLFSKNCIAVLEGHTAWVTAVCVSSDGKSLFSSSWDNTVRVWDIASGVCSAVLEGHKGWTTSVCVSVDGKFLFSSSDDFTVRVWDLALGKCSAVLEGHTSEVNSVCVSSDGKSLFSSSGDKSVRIWDLATGRCSAVLKGHNGGVTSVCLSEDGYVMFSSSDDNTVRVWNLFSCKCSAIFEGHTSSVTSVCLSVDGKTVFSSSKDKTIRAWDWA